MKRYEKYKNSGIEWLGEIPEDWEVKRVKDIFRNTGSGTTPPSGDQTYYADFGINWLQTGDLNDGYIIETSKKITQKSKTEYSTLKLYPKDSLVIAMYGATIGKMGFLKINTTTNQACCVLSNLKDNNERYIFYQLLSMKNFVISLSTGGGQPNINQDVVKFLKLVTPPFNLQTAIAAYLDTITTAIDRKIELLTAKADKYKALRRSLINETVCRGLNPDVSLKDSGIEWIGMVPEHWEVKRVKDAFKYTTGNTPESKNESYYEGNNTWICIGDISEDKYISDSKMKISDKAISDLNMIKTPKGSLLYSFKLSIGKMAFVKQDVYTNEAILSIFPNKRISLDFIYYMLPYFLELAATENIYGAKMLNQKLIANAFLVIPRLDEQIQIASYLDIKTTQIDTILTNINEQITKLTQLRKTLINDVVTGKIKVTD